MKLKDGSILSTGDFKYNGTSKHMHKKPNELEDLNNIINLNKLTYTEHCNQQLQNTYSFQICVKYAQNDYTKSGP